MLKRGVYAASLSVLNKDLTLNVEATISHAENLIKNGLHGCFFFGSTGMSQLISKNEKMELISKISTHKQRKHFYLGTGCNSLNENIELIKFINSKQLDDEFLFLLSGGGSSLVENIVEGFSLEELMNLTDALLSRGYNINDINAIRKHFS